MEDEKDPALKPEETADSAGEEVTPVAPQAGGEHAEPSEDKPEGKSDEDGSREGEREEYEVFFEDEEPQPPAPKDSAAWARIRKSEREAKQRAAELERKLQALSQPTGAPDPGPEPTLEDCDYDQDVLKKRLREHFDATERKRAAEAEHAKKAEADRRAAQALVDNYAAKKAVLSKRVNGYADSEAAVIAMLSPERQDVLLKIADDPANVVYALGRRSDVLDDLAKEPDRDRFVAKLKALEVKIKVQKKGTPPPPPEEPVRGAGVPGPAGSTLERLRAEAEKTGDYSKVNAYKRKQRGQQNRSK